MIDVKGKRVLVVGLGKSGVASALFLEKRGARVAVSDVRTEEQLPQEIPLLLDHGISVETGQHGERTFRDQDLIVVSPGVPFDVPQLVHPSRRHCRDASLSPLLADCVEKGGCCGAEISVIQSV